MAVNFRPFIQISSDRLSNSRFFKVLNLQRCDKKSLFSWGNKKEEKSTTSSGCKPDTPFVGQSSCRKRMPQCPEFIDKGDPSKCCEKDYGKPIKEQKTWWTNVKPTRALIKQKPSNCPPPPCPKEEVTFREYIFGPEKPLPDPRTCRRAWKMRETCRPLDPRLDDPRYKSTKGDVLLYTEPDKSRVPPTLEPQPKAPTPYRAPAGVICKKFRDSVASTAVDCYCACADPCLFDEALKENSCPVHAKSFKLPYSEMKPKNRKSKYFTGKQGVAAEDVMAPPQSSSCSCVHSAFIEKSKTFLPKHETCELHDAIRRSQQLKQNEVIPGVDKIMSKVEKHKLIKKVKEKQLNEVKVPVENPSLCQSKCKEIVVQS